MESSLQIECSEWRKGRSVKECMDDGRQVVAASVEYSDPTVYNVLRTVYTLRTTASHKVSRSLFISRVAQSNHRPGPEPFCLTELASSCWSRVAKKPRWFQNNTTKTSMSDEGIIFLSSPHVFIVSPPAILRKSWQNSVLAPSLRSPPPPIYLRTFTFVTSIRLHIHSTRCHP